MSPRVVLVGLPAAGKTSAGRKLARRLGVPFADSDALIEARDGRTIPQIFLESGEPVFRALEVEVIAEALASFEGVLALGGGAVLSSETRERLRESGGPVVHLVTTVDAALSLVRGGRGRPVLGDDPARRLAELEAERAPLYAEVASVSVRSAGRPMMHIVEDLVAVIQPAPSPS